MKILFTVFALLAGLICVYLIKSLAVRKQVIGVLRIDQSDQDAGAYLFLELNSSSDVSSIMGKKYATFRVVVKDFLPHE